MNFIKQVAVELQKDKKHARKNSSSKKAAGVSSLSLKTPARTPEAWASQRWGDTHLELRLMLYRNAKVTKSKPASAAEERSPIVLSCGS